MNCICRNDEIQHSLRALVSVPACWVTVMFFSQIPHKVSLAHSEHCCCVLRDKGKQHMQHIQRFLYSSLCVSESVYKWISGLEPNTFESVLLYNPCWYFCPPGSNLLTVSSVCTKHGAAFTYYAPTELKQMWCKVCPDLSPTFKCCRTV